MGLPLPASCKVGRDVRLLCQLRRQTRVSVMVAQRLVVRSAFVLRGRGRGETRNMGSSGISPVSGLRDDYSPRRDEPSGPEEANHWGTALVQVAEAIQTI